MLLLVATTLPHTSQQKSESALRWGCLYLCPRRNSTVPDNAGLNPHQFERAEQPIYLSLYQQMRAERAGRLGSIFVHCLQSLNLVDLLFVTLLLICQKRGTKNMYSTPNKQKINQIATLQTVHNKLPNRPTLTCLVLWVVTTRHSIRCDVNRWRWRDAKKTASRGHEEYDRTLRTTSFCHIKDCQSEGCSWYLIVPFVVRQWQKQKIVAAATMSLPVRFIVDSVSVVRETMCFLKVSLCLAISSFSAAM